jgi:polar amino acid transport system substrate-binding protein
VTTAPPVASSVAPIDAGPKVPAAIAASKRIRVGSEITYPPLEFYKEGTKVAQGFDVDLCAALAAKLGDGIACEFTNGDFDKLLDDLAAKKYDVVISAVTDSKEREAKADFIDYLNVGMSVIIKKGNPLRLKDLDGLCGRAIGAQKGTTEERFAKLQNTDCINGGHPGLTIVTVTTDAESLAKLKGGRLAADLEDYPAAAYTVKTSGGGNDFELLGSPTVRLPYGIAVAKDNADLRDALVAALRAILADNTYDKLLDKWEIHEGALRTAAVNGG